MGSWVTDTSKALAVHMEGTNGVLASNGWPQSCTLDDCFPETRPCLIFRLRYSLHPEEWYRSLHRRHRSRLSPAGEYHRRRSSQLYSPLDSRTSIHGWRLRLEGQLVGNRASSRRRRKGRQLLGCSHWPDSALREDIRLSHIYHQRGGCLLGGHYHRCCHQSASVQAEEQETKADHSRVKGAT